jgi:hypothetical protein
MEPEHRKKPEVVQRPPEPEQKEEGTGKKTIIIQLF